MRILHTVEFYHPHVGGAEEVVRQVSERLVKRGHQVTVATSSDPTRKFRELNGVVIQEFPIHGNWVKGIKGNIKLFVDLITSGNFDLIMNYAAQSWPTDLMFSVLDKINVPKVIAPCGYSGLVGWRRLVYLFYFHKLPRYLKKYDSIIYHSANYRDKLFGDQHDLRNYVVIPNAVDSKEFVVSQPSFREAYNIATPYLLLSVGNHYRSKGHDRVINMFNALNRKDVTLAIIGRQINNQFRSCWSCCQKEAQKNPRVILIDNAPRPLVSSAFSEADLFIFGSHIEAFPLVILEAMASETPYVTFDVGNVRELGGGFVVNSVAEMVARVNQLLDDKLLRNTEGLRGKTLQSNQYEWEKVVDQYEHLYRKLLVKS